MSQAWPLSISTVLADSWKLTKQNFFVIWFYLIIGFILPMVPNVLRSTLKLDGLVGAVVYLIGVVLSIVMSYGVIKVVLKIVDGDKPSFQDYLDVFPRLLNIIATTFLYTLIVIAGCFLLIVPGIIWSIKYQYAIYLAVDKGLGPMAALKASARLTNGLKWDVFAFGLVVQIVSMLGFLALIIGALWTFPLAVIAQSMYYRRLGQNAE
jgi:uncharacterized membrane protein